MTWGCNAGGISTDLDFAANKFDSQSVPVVRFERRVCFAGKSIKYSPRFVGCGGELNVIADLNFKMLSP